MVEYSVARTNWEREQARSLIYTVFMEELGYSAIRPDRFDATATYIVAKDSTRIIAAVRLILDGEIGLPLDAYTDLSVLRATAGLLAEVGRLACHPHHRTNLVVLRGIGCVKQAAQRFGATHAVIDSLLGLAPLYQRIGFLPFGAPFIDPTICRPNEVPTSPNAQVMWAPVGRLKGW